MNWKTKEIVVVAMVAAVIGVIFTLMDFIYMPLSAALGVVFMELTFGIYMLSALVPRIGMPASSRHFVSLIAVCPPNATTTPSGFSTRMIFSTSSGQSGSK